MKTFVGQCEAPVAAAYFARAPYVVLIFTVEDYNLFGMCMPEKSWSL